MNWTKIDEILHVPKTWTAKQNDTHQEGYLHEVDSEKIKQAQSMLQDINPNPWLPLIIDQDFSFDTMITKKQQGKNLRMMLDESPNKQLGLQKMAIISIDMICAIRFLQINGIMMSSMCLTDWMVFEVDSIRKNHKTWHCQLFDPIKFQKIPANSNQIVTPPVTHNGFYRFCSRGQHNSNDVYPSQMLEMWFWIQMACCIGEHPLLTMTESNTDDLLQIKS